MVRHLFKLIWNKKNKFSLITEMLVSFIVIFAVFTLLVYFYVTISNQWALIMKTCGPLSLASPII